MLEERLNERVAKLEAVTDDHKDEINRLKDDNVLLHRLTANQEFLSKLMEDSQQTHKETRETLQEINQNMHNLNKTQEKMQVELSAISTRVEKVEQRHESEISRGKFDVVEFLSKDAMKYIGIALIAAILYYIGWVK